METGARGWNDVVQNLLTAQGKITTKESSKRREGDK